QGLIHAFPILRTLQLESAYLRLQSSPPKEGGVTPLAGAEQFREYFESLIHVQLSYKMIPDSRFDPAQLVFALEGSLLLGPTRLDDGTIARIFSVLTECQQGGDPYWRPLTPFVATKQGKVLFPVSVEVANSLLRACRRLDESRLHGTYFSRYIELF